MSKVQPVTVEDAKGELKEIYQSLQKSMGKVVNIFQTMGNSPAVLKGFLAFSEAANHTTLSDKLREEIALLVGQINHCEYCLSAHSAIAKMKGLNDEEIIKARQGEASDPKGQAILKFAKQMVESRGNISNKELASLKAAGVDDTELVEIIFVVMLNMFTNYFNHITDPVIDFPEAPDID